MARVATTCHGILSWRALRREGAEDPHNGRVICNSCSIRLAISAEPLRRVGGNVLLVSESGGDNADTVVLSFNGFQYIKISLASRVPGVNEGASFADCGVPTATPTATSTATATFTPTATFPPTATATFRPTATASETWRATPSRLAGALRRRSPVGSFPNQRFFEKFLFFENFVPQIPEKYVGAAIMHRRAQHFRTQSCALNES